MFIEFFRTELDGKVYGCPGEEWSGYRLSCYFVARNKTSWSEAQSYCKVAGGDLASILDEGEQAFVYSLLPKSRSLKIDFDRSSLSSHVNFHFILLTVMYTRVIKDCSYYE